MRSLGDSDPRQVGPYRVLAELDADETGSLLLGSALDGRLVAVKLVSARLAADAGFPQRFALEVAALRQVSGIYTTPIIDAGPAEATPWLASEFLPGVSLRQMIERGVLLGEDAALRLAAGLVGALTEIHRAGLVHRDLTPVNVQLTEDGVRVLDFGIARAVDHDVSYVVGSPEFMSPEQASGRPVTPASDVFSLGEVLHLAATGRSLFAGATRAETLAQVVQARPELSPSLPSRIRQLLAACLAEEPLQRPTLDQLLAMIGSILPGAQPWPSLVQSMIAEQHTEIASLLGQQNADAPTMRMAPVFVPAPPPPRTTRPRRAKPDDERWKPDMWAVVSGGAVLVTVVFAVIMFNALTPAQPIGASERESSAAHPNTTGSTTTTTTTTTTTQQVPFGQITGLAGKCMDIAGANAANGTPVQLYECNGTDAQQWEFSADGTVQSLGKCLDVSGGNTEDGTKVQIYDCNGTGAQQWAVAAEGRIINVESNKCLDVPQSRSDDGTQLIIWTCHGEENQVWIPPV